MIGAIIGDIVGSRFEFNNTNSYDFELFSGNCSFTDDTICTIAIADAINASKGSAPNYKEKLASWCMAYPNPQGGYGGSFRMWICSQEHKPYNSFGNGSAMRVAPVAWAYDNLDKVLAEAERTASITHNHLEGIKGAQAVAHAIFHLRTTKNLQGLESIATHYYPRLLTDIFTPGVFDETCQGTVPVAFKIMLASTSFEDAIRKAISWGGDSDTIGAIVGSMAEAVFGIPEDIYNEAFSYLNPEIKSVIELFFNQLSRQKELISYCKLYNGEEENPYDRRTEEFEHFIWSREWSIVNFCPDDVTDFEEYFKRKSKSFIDFYSGSPYKPASKEWYERYFSLKRKGE